MINKTKTAHLLVKLEILKDQLNNEILPLLSFCNSNDDCKDLTQVMKSGEILVEDINNLISGNIIVLKPCD